MNPTRVDLLRNESLKAIEVWKYSIWENMAHILSMHK